MLQVSVSSWTQAEIAKMTINANLSFATWIFISAKDLLEAPLAPNTKIATTGCSAKYSTCGLIRANVIYILRPETSAHRTTNAKSLTIAGTRTLLVSSVMRQIRRFSKVIRNAWKSSQKQTAQLLVGNKKNQKSQFKTTLKTACTARVVWPTTQLTTLPNAPPLHSLHGTTNLQCTPTHVTQQYCLSNAKSTLKSINLMQHTLRVKKVSCPHHAGAHCRREEVVSVRTSWVQKTIRTTSNSWSTSSRNQSAILRTGTTSKPSEIVVGSAIKTKSGGLQLIRSSTSLIGPIFTQTPPTTAFRSSLTTVFTTWMWKAQHFLEQSLPCLVYIHYFDTP